MSPSAESTVGVSVQQKLLKQAHKRLERFVTLFSKALVNEEPDTIHDLRVWSRRLQQTLRFILGKPSPPKTRKLIRTLRQVRRTYGPCRNLDVNIDLIEEKYRAAGAAIVRQSWDMVRQNLETQRGEEISQARKKMARYDIVAFATRAQAVMESADLDAGGVERLEGIVRDALADWHEAYEVAHENRSVDHLHALRIAAKRLRYRAELLAEISGGAMKPAIKSLKEFQALLGDWHDRCVLLEHIADFISRPDFLVDHPDLGRTLLAEMEKEKLHNEAAVEEILSKAPQVRDCWDRVKFNGAS
ncbi:MAG TPA: CHAD domain-containing protein [Candidatus Binatia bacterium]|nr:CHAD domain-containing protein [Candidatus Binatia bacterium]